MKPIITTGHLFDFAGLKGRSLNLGEEITVADLEGCQARQKMTADAIKPGDCVFLNTGWASLWNKDNAQYVKGEPGNARDGILRSIRDARAREAVLVDFAPVKGSRIGEVAARFEIVLGVTPEG